MAKKKKNYELAEIDYMAGMKYKDIAKKYGVSINTVKSWKQRYKWNRDGVHTKNENSVHTKESAKEEVKILMENEELTDKQKKKLMIADNKVFSLGIDNLETLNDFLEELNNDLDIPGFDEEILKTMVAEAEEVTEKLSKYGTLDEEEIETIKQNKERKETKIENAILEEKSSINQPTTYRQDENIENDEEITDVRKFVICPKCGEKIWL